MNSIIILFPICVLCLQYSCTQGLHCKERPSGRIPVWSAWIRWIQNVVSKRPCASIRTRGASAAKRDVCGSAQIRNRAALAEPLRASMCVRPAVANKKGAGMSRARSKSKQIRKAILAARQELLRFHRTTARFNAAIRRSLPLSHRLAKSMERHTSGLINDAPTEVQSFVGAAADACYKTCLEEEAACGEDVGRYN